MKREIKFKSWDNGKKEFGFPIEFKTNGSIDGSIDGFVFECLESCYAVMQYTGLKDKNGQEIYEGDIIVWSGTLDGCIFNHVCEVIFDLYQWCGWAIYSPQQKSTIPFGEHGCNPNEVNIVGNVYENKELLKTK